MATAPIRPKTYSVWLNEVTSKDPCPPEVEKHALCLFGVARALFEAEAEAEATHRKVKQEVGEVAATASAGVDALLGRGVRHETLLAIQLASKRLKCNTLMR